MASQMLCSVLGFKSSAISGQRVAPLLGKDSLGTADGTVGIESSSSHTHHLQKLGTLQRL